MGSEGGRGAASTCLARRNALPFGQLLLVLLLGRPHSDQAQTPRLEYASHLLQEVQPPGTAADVVQHCNAHDAIRTASLHRSQAVGVVFCPPSSLQDSNLDNEKER